MSKRYQALMALTSIMISFLLINKLLTNSASAASSGGKKHTKPSTTTKAINYVALGDSIATGTVTNWSSITSYVTYFSQYLQTYYRSSTEINAKNLSHDWDRSNELLYKLQNDLTIQAAVASADVITISIGGNNLMKAAKIPGFTVIDNNLAIHGVFDFQNQWPQIIDKIKALNTKSAKIIVNTIYNPYNLDENLTSGYKADTGLHKLVDSYLSGTVIDSTGKTATGINDVIKNNISKGYMIADLYSKFSGYLPGSMGSITYFYPNLLSYILRNPHPNTAGQKIITECNKTAFYPY